MALHSLETGTSLHFTRVDQSALAGAQPSGAPSFIGQEKFDSVLFKRWIATGASAQSDWKQQLGPDIRAYVHATGGVGTHASLSAALADSNVPAGSKIVVASNQVLTSTLVITKANLVIEFLPGAEIQNSGAGTGLDIQADNVSIIGARFTGFIGGGEKAITINAAANYITVNRCRFAASTTTEIEDNNGNSASYGNFSE